MRSRQRSKAGRHKAGRAADPLELYDVVRTTESDLILGEESFRLRVELARSRKSRTSFRANVWRAELYRLQPTFPQAKGGPAHKDSDELIWVDWSRVLRTENQPFSAASASRAENRVLRELRAWVRHTRGECSRQPHTWSDCPDGGEAGRGEVA